MTDVGKRVWNTTTGESGVILGGLQWGGVRVQVDVNPEEWRDSVIGPPSRVTAVWERWNITSFDPRKEEFPRGFPEEGQYVPKGEEE